MTTHTYVSFLACLLVLTGSGCSSEVEPDEPGRALPPIVGERLDTGCPVDDRCDPGTEGAAFSGAFDISALAHTAVGGTQRVSIAVLSVLSGDAPNLVVDSSATDVLAVVSVVETTDPHLANVAGLPEETLFPQARVLGVGEGSASLVVRTTDGLLVDRIEMTVRDVASVQASVMDASGPGTSFYVTAEDAEGELVFDRDLEVRGAAPVRAVDECYFCFTTEGPIADPVELTVVFAGREHDIDVVAAR